MAGKSGSKAGSSSKPRSKATRSGPGGRSAVPRSPMDLPARDRETGLVHVIVDTPKGSPVKFKYEPSKAGYTISHILPAGAVFPFDFGSIPGTAAEDGDPMDVLILVEWPTFAGCIVPVRLVGALEAEQTQEGETVRNDRLIGVAESSRTYADVSRLGDLPGKLVAEIEHFFVSYNEERGRDFRVRARLTPERSGRLVSEGEKRFREKTRPRGR
jgi:inorganic pyrophosphatase